MLENYRDMMTVSEVSAALNICPGKTYSLLNSGEIEAFRCRKVWCVPKESVEKYIKHQMELAKSTEQETGK